MLSPSCHAISTPVAPEAATTIAVGTVVTLPGIVPFTVAIAAAGSPVTAENWRLYSAWLSKMVGSAVIVASGGGTTEKIAAMSAYTKGGIQGGSSRRNSKALPGSSYRIVPGNWALPASTSPHPTAELAASAHATNAGGQQRTLMILTSTSKPGYRLRQQPGPTSKTTDQGPLKG